MKYMTFNSSCSYAGIANMLARYGVETDDRTIALRMNLPYLFSCKDGVYTAGPMLQSAEWFNLYLNPIGFQMEEFSLPADRVTSYLKNQKTAMLGLRVSAAEKHAVVYIGCQNDHLVFLNNKWEADPAPEKFLLTAAELTEKVDSIVTIATLKEIPPVQVDFFDRLNRSISAIRQNFSDIQALCKNEASVSLLHSKLNTLFRPLLLDGITMLELAEKHDLAQRFSAIQRCFLSILRQSSEQTVVLAQQLPMDEFSSAVEDYIRLISEFIRTL